MERIYLLEDDDSIRKLVIYALGSQGYEAQGFDRPSDFWSAMEGPPTAIITPEAPISKSFSVILCVFPLLSLLFSPSPGLREWPTAFW